MLKWSRYEVTLQRSHILEDLYPDDYAALGKSKSKEVGPDWRK